MSSHLSKLRSFSTCGMYCMNRVQIVQNVVGRWQMVGKLQTIKSLVNAGSLLLMCARVLHEFLLEPVSLYGSETMIWRENFKIQNYECTD